MNSFPASTASGKVDAGSSGGKAAQPRGRGNPSDSPLPSASPANWHLDIESLVDTLFVQPLNQLRHRQFEDLADAEQSGDCDWPTGLHLLPVPGREAETQHVFLRKAALLAKLPHPRTQSAEELVLIRHPLRCKDLRAETPRAD